MLDCGNLLDKSLDFHLMGIQNFNTLNLFEITDK